MKISVRRLTPEDYAALREIRLEALRLHPECFSADPAVEEAFTKEEWLARLASAVTFGGFAQGALSGIVVFSKPRSVKLAHTGDLGAMYVREAARGSGLAGALINAVVDQATREVEQLKLTVNADNARAIALYERHGFRTIGRIPKSLRINGRDYDELMMVRQISTSD
jgi:ribosomal protein S18 acetylase RimI-like enzyme